MFSQSISQSFSGFNITFDRGQNFLKLFVFLLRRLDLETLNDRQAGIDHGRKLARKDNDIFLGYLGLKKGQIDFNVFRFFFDLEVGDAFFPQVKGDNAFGECFSFTLNFLALAVFALPFECVHNVSLSFSADQLFCCSVLGLIFRPSVPASVSIPLDHYF